MLIKSHPSIQYALSFGLVMLPTLAAGVFGLYQWFYVVSSSSLLMIPNDAHTIVRRGRKQHDIGLQYDNIIQ